MNKYHKIKNVFVRDRETKMLIDGDFTLPVFEYLRDNEWSASEKIDGTNIRTMFDGEKIFFGGKSDRAQIPTELANKLNETFLPQLDNFKTIFKSEGLEECNVCLYGEGYGPKIQKGGKYRDDQDFVLFDVKVGRWWLQREDVENIATELGIDVVPIVYIGTLNDIIYDVKEGFNSTWGDFIAEGIVARPKVELKTRNGERVIVKVKHKDFKEKV